MIGGAMAELEAEEIAQSSDDGPEEEPSTNNDMNVQR